MPPGHLVLQTIRSHDQFNTTVYGLDDRYRGIHGGRRVVFVTAEDLAERGLADGDLVDLVSVWSDGERRAPAFRVVEYPTTPGCAAAYFPEATSWCPGLHRGDSNTPTSKSIVIRLDRRLAKQKKKKKKKNESWTMSTHYFKHRLSTWCRGAHAVPNGRGKTVSCDKSNSG